MNPPTPSQCAAAADALRRAATDERNGGDEERADILTKAAEIMDAKALVGAMWRILKERKTGGPVA